MEKPAPLRVPALKPPGPRPLASISRAYVSLLYGEACQQYFLGVLTVAYALIRHQCVYPRVLLHTPDVPRELLDLAAKLGAFSEILPTDYVEASEVFFSNPQAHARFGKVFTKYQVLGLTQYERVLFLDADLHVRGNLDHLFELPPPAAMARGPNKPPAGSLLQPRAPVNAGVMLFQPDAEVLAQLLGEIVGPNPRRLPNYNSPDADFLTEHPAFYGQWSSLPLEYNYQLEFDKLSPEKGTVSFSAKREAHFSEEGASMPWDQVRVAHFSGAKPWEHLVAGGPTVCAALRCLRHTDAGMFSGLGEKLVAGIREYANEVACLQALCARFQLGKGTLWRETRAARQLFRLPPETAQARLQDALPRGGSWNDGPGARSFVWTPPPSAASSSAAAAAKDGCEVVPSSSSQAPCGAYVEVASYTGGVDATLVVVGDTVRLEVEGGAKRNFEVLGVDKANNVLQLRRRLALPHDWQQVEDTTASGQVAGKQARRRFYYENTRTGATQWSFPGLPAPWQAATDAATDDIYYHDPATGETRWDPPDFEEILRPASDVETIFAADGLSVDCCSATVWCRPSSDDEKMVADLRAAISSAMQR